MFQLATRYFTLSDAVSSFSFLKQTCLKTYPVVVEKMLLCYRKVKLLVCIKQRKQVQRPLKIRSGTVQHILKTWKHSDEPSSSSEKCCQKKRI